LVIYSHYDIGYCTQWSTLINNKIITDQSNKNVWPRENKEDPHASKITDYPDKGQKLEQMKKNQLWKECQ